MAQRDSLKRLLRRHPWLKSAFSPILERLQSRERRRVATYTEVLASLSKVLADDPVVRLDEFRGNFVIGAESDLFRRIVYRQAYETGLARLVADRVDHSRDVIDVGANIGFYSVLFAKLIHGDRRVLAVEPVPDALSRLRRNLSRNGVSEKVVVVEGIATDCAGKSFMNVIPGKEEYSSSGALVHPSALRLDHHQLEVNAFTLDELVGKFELNPGLIKIDVEGGEHKVINGAAETLRRFQPTLIMESSDPLLKEQGSSAASLISQCRKFGYTVLDAHDPQSPPDHKQYTELLCIPTTDR